MAQAPNYFYNSPWIADAARNLASALKPPDPQELLAREQARWQFDRQKQLAGIQDTERERDLLADQALTELYMDEPAVNPLTGEIDDKQTAINRRNIAARAVAGGREYIDPTESLLGPYSPTFESKQILAAIKAAATEQQIQQRFGNQMDLTRYVQGQQNERQQNMFGQQFSMEAFRQSGRFQLQNARAQSRLLEIQERAKNGGGNPMKITGKALEDLLTFMEMKIQETGAQMPQGYRDELLTRMAIEASKTGNIPLATEQVWAEAGLPEGPTQAEEPGFFGGIMRRMGLSSAPQTLTPNFGQPRPAAPPLGGATSSTETTTSLGGALRQPAYDMAPAGVSQAEYDIALNRTMQTGRPPDLSSALGQPPVPQVAPPPVDVGPPAPAPKPAPNKAKPPAAKPPAAKPSTKSLPKPKNKQEFDALPKGAHFLDPNGEERIKP
jgi:hypothetical protein